MGDARGYRGRCCEHCVVGLLIGLFYAVDARAQEPDSAPPPPTITGVVRALDGKTPIPNAVVVLTNTTFAALTDDKGAYELLDVPPGNYELRISSAGYDDAVLPIVVTADAPLTLSTTMQKTVTGE